MADSSSMTAEDVRQAWYGLGAAPSDRFVEFHSDATYGLELGADALIYVMTHGHTISVSDAALYAAQKVGVCSIARRVDSEGRPVDPSAGMLADVNRALDLIALSLRTRDRLATEDSALQAAQPAADCPQDSDRPAGGLQVPIVAPQPAVPPSDGAAQQQPKPQPAQQQPAQPQQPQPVRLPAVVRDNSMTF